MKDFISVIIPTYQERESLRSTLNSFTKQTNGQFEIVIVNNNTNQSSIPFLESMIKDFNLDISLLSPMTNLGAGGGRNHGVKNSKGTIVAFTDDDCLVHDDWIQSIYDSNLSENKVIFGKVYSDVPPISPFIHAFEMNGQVFGSGNCAFLKSFFEEINGFDITLNNWAEDFEIGARCEKINFPPQYKENLVVNHPPKLLTYRYRAHFFSLESIARYLYITKVKGYTYKSTFLFDMIKTGLKKLILLLPFMALAIFVTPLFLLMVPFIFSLFQIKKFIKVKQATESYSFENKFSYLNFFKFSTTSWIIDILNSFMAVYCGIRKI